MELEFRGKGTEEKGYDSRGNIIVAVDSAYFRPSEVETLVGDPTLARKHLSWTPRVEFDGLVEEMLNHDLQLARREQTLRSAGFHCPVSPEYD
jgi:GDPmannose 4,6-dehydratase